MRELTSLSDAVIAKRLADYLLTLGIKTKLMEEKTGTEVWIVEEDKVEEARKIWEEFNQSPDDPKYQSAKMQAKQIRSEEKKKETEYYRRIKRASDIWVSSRPRDIPVTFAFIILSLVVSLVSGMLTSYGYNEVGMKNALWFTFADEATELPMIGPNGESHGSYKRYDKITGLKSGQVWRLVTPIFLHLSIWHLLVNLYLFHGFAGLLECHKGKLWLITCAVTSAIVTNVLQYKYPIQPSDFGLSIWGGMAPVNLTLFSYLLVKTHFAPEPALRLHIPVQLYGAMGIWLLLLIANFMGGWSITGNLAGFGVGVILGLASKLKLRS